MTFEDLLMRDLCLEAWPVIIEYTHQKRLVVRTLLERYNVSLVGSARQISAYRRQLLALTKVGQRPEGTRPYLSYAGRVKTVILVSRLHRLCAPIMQAILLAVDLHTWFTFL